MTLKYKPLKSKGRRGEQMDRIQRHVWPIVLGRVPYRACEGCGEQKVGVEWAHLFGRPGTGFGLGAWANSVELTAKLCRRCHNIIDRHLDEGGLAHELRGRAMARLVLTLTGKPTEAWEPYEGIRVVIAKAEETGWHFDEEKCALVKAA